MGPPNSGAPEQCTISTTSTQKKKKKSQAKKKQQQPQQPTLNNKSSNTKGPVDKINVHVEYCGSWGYESNFEELRDRLLADANATRPSSSSSSQHIVDLEVVGTVGRRSSFEVTINQELIHSKLATSSFPEVESVVATVAKLRSALIQAHVDHCIDVDSNKKTQEVPSKQKKSNNPESPAGINQRRVKRSVSVKDIATTTIRHRPAQSKIFGILVVAAWVVLGYLGFSYFR